jgi:hypothetical protein
VRRPDLLCLAIALMLFLGSAGPAQVAHGGLFVCGDKLTGNDRSAALRAIKRAAGPRGIEWKTQAACVKRDSARIWIDLEREPRPDGSVMHPSLICTRGSHFWGCVENAERLLEVTLGTDARPQKLSVKLPANWDAADTKPLLESGFRQIPRLRQDQECDWEAGSAASPQMLENLKSEFSLDGEQKSFSIFEQDDEIWLENFTDVLVFRRVSDPASPFSFKCWQILIILG